MDGWRACMDEGTLRRASPVLRRLLVDGDYLKAWNDIGMANEPGTGTAAGGPPESRNASGPETLLRASTLTSGKSCGVPESLDNDPRRCNPRRGSQRSLRRQPCSPGRSDTRRSVGVAYISVRPVAKGDL